MVLGTVAELKTKRIAQRLLDPILARINSFDYRPSKFISVEKFADAWEIQVLTHQKPSSVKAVKSHLKTYIRKHLGKILLHELTPQIQQNFVTLLSQKVSRKTCLNVLGTLSSMMRTAKSWGYCTQPVTAGRASLAGRQDPQSTALFHRRASAQNNHDRLRPVAHHVRHCRNDGASRRRSCGPAKTGPRL